MSAGRCSGCGEPVDAGSAFQRVTGYVRHREQGGTNHVVCQERVPDVWVCARCIELLKRGGSLEQEALL